MRLRLFALLWLLLAGPVRADAIHVGHFSLLPGDGTNRHELRADVPADVRTGGPIRWPPGCRAAGETRQAMAGRTLLSLHFACAAPLAADAAIQLPWRLDGASFRPQGGAHSGILPDAAGITLPVGAALAGPRPWTTLAGDYLWQGMAHILTGWDHLAFVLCLCLLARGRRLVLLVTLFTLGHSISLAGGFYDWIRLPMPPVEAVIALSILFMAREAWHGGGDDAWQRQALITGSFGLLHGLGFATALSEMAVPAADRLLALLCFNLGVEAGQLLFVAAVLALLALAGDRGGRLVRPAALLIAGAMAGFWLLQRLAGFA
jgi:hydrogenase/urease accessory protein HupE